jgi:hypothetical protein
MPEPPGVEILLPEISGAWRRARRRVRDAETEFEERELFGRLEAARGEAGVVEQPPEVVAGIREMGRCGGRDPARVDAAEDASEPRS